MTGAIKSSATEISALEERMIQLRQTALVVEPSDPAHAQIIVELSKLYSDSTSYPADPTLYEWEVSKVDTTAAASGGFGECWKGLFLGRHQIAMKCSRSNVPPEIAMRRVEREMKVWKRLRHPNVMPFIGSIVFESPMRALFLISPWMENGDLGTYIKANPKADRLRLLTQIATGLEYLHTSDVVHGDLKAANVFISGTGDARIGDFGLSEVVSEMTGDTQGYSSAWKYGGNPRWQAPELWSDYKRTKPSDMFAFGRVIYEVYTGDFPFAHLNNPQIYSIVDRGELPPRLSGKNTETEGFSDDMWQFMAHCCEREPQGRPNAQKAVVYLLSLAALLNKLHAFNNRNFWLHQAARLGPPSAVMVLLGAGTNPNSCGEQGLRPLHFAAELMAHQDGDVAISALISAGAELDAKNDSGYTPLIVAASNGSPTAVRLLLDKGADPHIRGTDGYGPLHYAPALMGRPESLGLVAALVRRGADVNAVGGGNMSPLLRAAFCGSTAAVQALLDAGANPMGPIQFDGDLVQLATELMRDGDAACATTIGVILEGGTTVENKSKLATALIRFGISIRSFPFLKMLADKGRLPILSIMKSLREEMILSLPADPSEYLSLLAKLYDLFGVYPRKPSLHDCEVKQTNAKRGLGQSWKGIFLAHQKVAIKHVLRSISHDAVKRGAIREIGEWQHLQHPNVLPFIGLYIQGPNVYTLSPWTEKGDMYQYLKATPNADRPRLLLQIAEGLRYLHTSDPIVIHGDPKCANVFVSEAGVARLAGFGFSKLTAETWSDGHSDWLPQDWRWLAPELLMAANSEDVERTAASDMFAYGRVIVEAFTGYVPFPSVSLAAGVSMVKRGILPDRPIDPHTISLGLDDRMWEIMKDCGSFSPAHRPSAQTVIPRLFALIGFRRAQYLLSRKVM